MNKKILIVFLLSILVIMSFVQGVQINNLKKDIIGGSVSGIVAQTDTNNVNTYSKPPANVPAMVGGC